MGQGVGMVQMPCPEQEVWGGVLKTRMLALYGDTARVFPGVVKALRPIGLLYVRWAYRAMARKVAAQIDDYVSSGFTSGSMVRRRAAFGAPSTSRDSSATCFAPIAAS